MQQNAARLHKPLITQCSLGADCCVRIEKLFRTAATNRKEVSPTGARSGSPDRGAWSRSQGTGLYPVHFRDSQPDPEGWPAQARLRSRRNETCYSCSVASMTMEIIACALARAKPNRSVPQGFL